MRLAALAVGVSFLLGCPGVQQVDPVPDLKDAIWQLQHGHADQGFEAMSGMLGTIAARTDWYGYLGRARILSACFDAGAVAFLAQVPADRKARYQNLADYATDRALMLTTVAECWVGVLAGSSTLDAQREAARGLAACLHKKIDDSTLRCVQKENWQEAASEKLYRRLMLESLTDCERYLLGRVPYGQPRDPGPLISALNQLAVAFDELAALENVDPAVAPSWKASADQARADATKVQRDPNAVEATSYTRALVEADGRRQAEAASSCGEEAIQQMTGRASRDRIIGKVEAALRRFLLIVETQTGRDFPVKSIVAPVGINRKYWKEYAF